MAIYMVKYIVMLFCIIIKHDSIADSRISARVEQGLGLWNWELIINIDLFSSVIL